VLGIFAHPDDETFGPGGTLALLARGHAVHLVCATRGESGTIGDSGAYGRRALGAIRETELHGACRALGVRPPWILPFPDGGLHRLEEETLLRPFVRAVRAVRPDILVTFHEDGLSGHRDHRTVTQRVFTAFAAAAEERWPELGPPHAAARLWVYAIPESRAARITTRKLHAVPDDALDAVIDVTAGLPARRAAIAAHATQKPFMDWVDTQVEDVDAFWRHEGFMLREARVPLPADAARPVDDLLYGLSAAP
jgi:LmbE family N-acetylglucosaminyl deacetylase